MAAMTGFDRQRLMAALILAVTALFVSAGAPGAARWRRPLRTAALVGFALAVMLALAEIASWWSSIER
jgi:hypothetical protein